jgi:hypothetical protein
MSIYGKYRLLVFLTIVPLLISPHLSGQDMLVKSNGSRIMANIIDVTDDSVKFTNAYSNEDFVFVFPKSNIKYIEYRNGDIEYFTGSYQNLSLKDTISEFDRIDFDQNMMIIDSISITLQNLFSQQKLIFDFHNYSDTNLVVDKGKLSFWFENKKFNFTERCYPTDEKTVNINFLRDIPGSKKILKRLSEYDVKRIDIEFNKEFITMELTGNESSFFRNMFKNNQVTE